MLRLWAFRINIYGRQIRSVNGQWIFPFRRLSFRRGTKVSQCRDNRWANCFGSTSAVRNFPEASNGCANRWECTDMLVRGRRGGRLEMSLGGGWNVSLIYDVSRGKPATFGRARRALSRETGAASNASGTGRIAKIKINEWARKKKRVREKEKNI